MCSFAFVCECKLTRIAENLLKLSSKPENVPIRAAKEDISRIALYLTRAREREHVSKGKKKKYLFSKIECTVCGRICLYI